MPRSPESSIRRLQQVMVAFDLSPDETAALFGVSAGELRRWLTTGVPAQHLQRLAEIAAVAEILERRLVPGRLPAVARRPAAAYGGDTILNWLAAGRGDELLTSIRYSSTWSDRLAEDPASPTDSGLDAQDSGTDDPEGADAANTIAQALTELRRRGVRDELVAYVACVETRAIGRWGAETEVPSVQQADKVSHLAAIAARAGTVMKPSYVPVWLTKSIAALDGERPIDALRQGARQRVDRVLTSLEDPGAV